MVYRRYLFLRWFFFSFCLLSVVLGHSGAGGEDFNMNMAAPTSSHMIARCFVATETGTYFDGTGYLKAGETPAAMSGPPISEYKNTTPVRFYTGRKHGHIFPSLSPVSSYRVGLDVSIAFEFRTSRTSGVLLAISNQGNDGLGLEIVGGKVRGRDSGMGSASRRTFSFVLTALDKSSTTLPLSTDSIDV